MRTGEPSSQITGLRASTFEIRHCPGGARCSVRLVVKAAQPGPMPHKARVPGEQGSKRIAYSVHWIKTAPNHCIWPEFHFN